MTDRARDLLEIYLQDHVAGSTGGRELAKRLAEREKSSELGATLRTLHEDIETDAKTLLEIVEALDFSPHAPIKAGLAWIGEKLSRGKLNGRIVRRSPLSLVMELEGLTMGVSGKRALWESLAVLQRNDHRLSRFDMRTLLARADDQLDRIASLHDRAVLRAFTPSPSVESAPLTQPAGAHGAR